MFVAKVTMVLGIWVVVLFGSSHIEAAEGQVESGCSEYARQWINQIDQVSRPDVLIKHAQSDCEFSAKWIKKTSNSSSAANWNRTCTDLVLLWTHKKCIYFRDYIDHKTYEPCKEWTRQMFQHCISHNFSWFEAK